jgi:N,N'-diacetyllegionaminate synthase
VSPFSVHAVERLERIGVDAYKVASGQVTNLEMLEAIGRTGRRVIVSTGMTTHRESLAAWDAIGSAPWASLQCTSVYPCPPQLVGLNEIAELEPRSAAVRIGLSDHTLGMAASLAAIALGATVIERHVCFDRRGYGTDCRHSMTLDEFAAFVREARELERMLANPVDKDELAASPAMVEMRKAFLE